MLRLEEGRFYLHHDQADQQYTREGELPHLQVP